MSENGQSRAYGLSDQCSSGESVGEPTLNLLVKITQINGEALPLGNLQNEQWVIWCMTLTGIQPVCVVKLKECVVLIELDPKVNVIGVAQEIQKLISWEGLKSCSILPIQ